LAPAGPSPQLHTGEGDLSGGRVANVAVGNPHAMPNQPQMSVESKVKMDGTWLTGRGNVTKRPVRCQRTGCGTAWAPRRPCHGNYRRAERGKANQVYAAATASCHCAAASARKVRSVDRETRCRCKLNVLWTAAWILRKRCADRADLNRCILRSRRRTTVVSLVMV